MLDLELERIVAVDEQMLDERGLAVPDGFPVESVFLGRPSVDLDVLVRVVQQDVGVGLRDGERPDLFLGRAAGACSPSRLPTRTSSRTTPTA